jgi:hypothetical protein
MSARYVMCIDNKAYPHDLTLHKVYKVIPDARGEKFGDVRIVDDSGEDFLFPGKFFVTVIVPETAESTFELEVA